MRWASSPDSLSAHRGMSGPVGSLRAGSLTLVSTDQLDPHDNSPVNSLPQVGPGVQGRQGNERVEGVERKGVPVGQAPQRTGSGIADNIEIVESLTPDTRYGILPRDVLMEFAERRRNAIEEPVDRDPGSGIKIGHRQGEALGAVGRVGPPERG